MGLDMSTVYVLDSVWEDVSPGRTGGAASLDKVCEGSWGRKHSRRSVDYVEDLENSTEKRTG
eukprot:8534867-Prorocentrum_lima.AAC.1